MKKGYKDTQYTKAEWDLMHKGICPDCKKRNIKARSDFFECEGANYGLNGKCGWFITKTYANQTLARFGYSPIR